MGLFDTLTSKLFGTAHAKGGDAPAGTPAAGGDAANAHADPLVLLREKAAKHPEKLDWEHSIVDLMKLVGMDHSLEARKKMAEEQKYPGDMSDSAAMNVWLHQQVLDSIAKRGSI
ncbi:DUF3597 domain-containing protein [Robbsia sp. KACC 23696]|uniref:DUF3597 domain-containing protein n=1 Tax=Robbsia sp. KACC 23696 TaxID=3149231 RepID=UPI00325ADF4C